MKKLLLLVGLFALHQITLGQCDRKVTFTCKKARDFKNGSVGQEAAIDATIIIDNDKFSLTATFNGETETLEGEIKEVSTCEWKDFLKNGKTQYKVLAKKGNENPEKSIINIESEDSYTKITFGSDPDTGSRIQFDVFEYTITEEASTNKPPDKPVKKAKRSKKKQKLTQNMYGLQHTVLRN